MSSFNINFPKIPNGHGLSFKKGVADGILQSSANEQTPHETHSASYKRGIIVGIAIMEEINRLSRTQVDGALQISDAREA